MVLGILTLFIGPCSFGFNEGFGGSPGPLTASLFWRKMTYILMPIGAAVAIGAGIALITIDKTRTDSEEADIGNPDSGQDSLR